MKCPICKNKGIFYTSKPTRYRCGKFEDLGYWDVCECRKKNNKNKKNDKNTTLHK